MAAQFEDFSRYTRQFADSTRMAMENAESAFGLQLKALGMNVSATHHLLGEFAEVRNLDSYRALWPKSLQLARENLERMASASQEAMGISLKAWQAAAEASQQHADR